MSSAQMTISPATIALALIALFAFSVSVFSTPAFSSETIKPDEQIQFARGIAYFNSEGVVEAEITAWVYEQEQRPGARTVFAKLVGIDLDTLTEQEAANFDSRTQLFRFDSERGKRLTLQLAATNQVTLPVTDSDGISRSLVRLGPLADLTVTQTGAALLVSFQPELPKEDLRQFVGELVLVPDTGLSIVSDIDDTIKASNVLNRTELIRNTFLREFHAVPGMALRYTQFAGHADTTRFHYLSSSPHQLYPALDAFLKGNNFPLGSVHLRYIDVSEEIFGNGDSSRRHKLDSLRQLIRQFPHRQFLLIGDSGEADPEIYAEIASAFPQQVIGIYIRDVTGEGADAPRYGKTFAALPPTLWRIFREPDGLSLPERQSD